MKIRHLLLTMVGLGFLIALCNFSETHAIKSASMISQIQTGGTGSGTADLEFVEIYNASLTDVDATGWCVQYTSASDTTTHVLGCITAPDTETRIWLKAGGYVTLASSAYQTAAGVKADLTFSYTGMAAAGGHVRLLDAANNELDKVGWGTAANPETAAALAAPGGLSLARGALQDTDNNSVDFSVRLAPVIHVDGLYDIATVVDVCPNMTSAQATLPVGYEVDAAGDCFVDACNNIGGLQRTIPEEKESDGAGGCVDRDACANLDGIQAVLPNGYKLAAGGVTCLLDLLPLRITELLADASGSDTGNEFIELYNPGADAVELAHYRLQVGPALDKIYSFPAGATVPPDGYVVFYNSAVRFTLVNTSSRVGLVSADGQVIDQPPAYSEPPEAESWALIEGAWQYTNQPTPMSANLASIIDTTDTAEVTVLTPVTLKPCDVGQYRNPATGRCKKIEASSGLTPCKDGQYRSEETGRCRSIATVATAALKPCADDEFRNPETNRCKKIASTEDVLQSCEEGYERNPATNRCRKVLAASTTAGVVPATVVDNAKDTGWDAWTWALAAVGATSAIGYGVYEWRHELRGFGQKVAARFGKK